MGILILGVITIVNVFCFFKLFPMGCKELSLGPIINSMQHPSTINPMLLTADKKFTDNCMHMRMHPIAIPSLVRLGVEDEVPLTLSHLMTPWCKVAWIYQKSALAKAHEY